MRGHQNNFRKEEGSHSQTTEQVERRPRGRLRIYSEGATGRPKDILLFFGTKKYTNVTKPQRDELRLTQFKDFPRSLVFDRGTIIYIMTVLLAIVTNKIIGYVSHPKADIMYCIFTSIDIGVIIRANDKVFWALNSSNPTMEDFYEFVSMSMYGCIYIKVQYIAQEDFEDKFYEHINRGQISIMFAHDINKRSIINEEDAQR